MKRRNFVNSLIASSAVLIAGNLSVSAAQYVKKDNPTAVALRYVENAEQAERGEKMGVPGEEQICANCRFYKDPQADAAGCSLFANQLVPAEAWCAGWAPLT